MTSGRHLLSIFVYFVLVVAAAFGGTVVVAVLTPRATPAAQAWFLKGALVMLLVVAITHYHLRRADQRWSSFGVIQDRIPGSTFSGGLLGILLAGLWCFVVWYLAPFDVSRNAQLIPLQFVTASLGTVAMGIAEEVGYRTYGMRELQRAGGDLLAVLLPSALFVAVHVAGGVPWQAGILVVGSASILFSVLMLGTNNLPFVVALHVATNLVQDNVIRPSESASLFAIRPTGAPVASEPLLLWTMVAAINLVATAVAFGWLRRRRRS